MFTVRKTAKNAKLIRHGSRRISFSKGLWRLPPRHRGECDPERGKPDQAADPHHPAGHREAPSLGSHLYLIFCLHLQ